MLSLKKKLCCTQEEEDPDIVIEEDLITQEDLSMQEAVVAMREGVAEVVIPVEVVEKSGRLFKFGDLVI